MTEDRSEFERCTPGRVIMSRFTRRWPQYGCRLEPADYDAVAEIFAKKDNSSKWSHLARYVHKAGMGKISPDSLAADWRRARDDGATAPEKEDLGGDDPEK
jgi:hypothetical protein